MILGLCSQPCAFQIECWICIFPVDLLIWETTNDVVKLTIISFILSLCVSVFMCTQQMLDNVLPFITYTFPVS